MKYIIIEDETGFQHGLVFPDTIEHSFVGTRFGPRVKSAGFCHISDTDVVTWGESVSLGLIRRKEDSLILTKDFFDA